MLGGPVAIFTLGPLWRISWRDRLWKLRLHWFALFSFALCGSQECAYSTAHVLNCEKIIFDTSTRSGSQAKIALWATWGLTR